MLEDTLYVVFSSLCRVVHTLHWVTFLE